MSGTDEPRSSLSRRKCGRSFTAQIAPVRPPLPSTDPDLLPISDRIGQEGDLALVSIEAGNHARLRRRIGADIEHVTRRYPGDAVHGWRNHGDVVPMHPAEAVAILDGAPAAEALRLNQDPALA